MMQKKICMVGSPSVGKTSLVARYVRSLFSDKYLSSVGVKVDKKQLAVDGRELTLMLWDLAGDDEFQPLRPSYLRGAAGYLLVVDGCRSATLDHALELQLRVTQFAGSIPFALLLNKVDLVNEWEIDNARMAGLTARGWTVRQTSARDGSGVEAAFAELARMILGPGPGGVVGASSS